MHWRSHLHYPFTWGGNNFARWNFLHMQSQMVLLPLKINLLYYQLSASIPFQKGINTYFKYIFYFSFQFYDCTFSETELIKNLTDWPQEPSISFLISNNNKSTYTGTLQTSCELRTSSSNIHRHRILQTWTQEKISFPIFIDIRDDNGRSRIFFFLFFFF